MDDARTKPKGRVTPLWIFAAFLTFTEVVVVYAVTKTTGAIQGVLTAFVIIYALLVAVAFFLILWNRPYVFYPPSEYGSSDPKHFIDALRSSVSPKVLEQVRIARQIETSPKDKSAQFQLIDSLLDALSKQILILMHEKNLDLPYTERYYPNIQYQYGTPDQSWGGGLFTTAGIARKLEGTGLIEIVQRDGVKLALTDEGRDFAQWLISNNRRATFLQTPYGGWGKPHEPFEAANGATDSKDSHRTQCTSHGESP